MPEQDFRAAMRCLAATVNLVTIEADGRPLGMVATAVSSLSAAPPSVLICVNETATMHDRLISASHFCVNILHQEQREIAQLFADSETRNRRFATGNWDLDGAAPRLRDAQAALVCERTQQFRFATHTIIVGLVCEVRVRAKIDPLLWLDGRYGKAG